MLDIYDPSDLGAYDWHDSIALMRYWCCRIYNLQTNRGWYD